MPCRPASEESALRRLLTDRRLGPFLSAQSGSRRGALALYEWNIDAAGSAMELTGMVEVFLRNALVAELRSLAAGRGRADWTEALPLDARGRADVANARARVRRRGTGAVPVAELTFGFWRYLVSRRYLTTGWIPAMSAAFPHLNRDPATARRMVEHDVQQLHFLRNRAAHLEPLFRRDLAADVDRAGRLVGWIDPAAAEWMLRRDRLRVDVRRRPAL